MKRRQLLMVLGLAAAISAPVQAQQFFRIGTGGTAGTYYPVGGMIANAVSQPGKIVATAQATNGSVANVNGVAGGALESGFSQSDVATWAYTGTGVYEGKPKVTDLRMIANLYPESIHLVVKKGSGIKSVSDLKGKRVALDEPGSGTLVNARIVLAAYGVKESDIKPEYIKPNQAGDKLKDGALDAFFFVGGAPAGAIAELASSGTGIELVPLSGPQARARCADHGHGRPVGDQRQGRYRNRVPNHQGAVRQSRSGHPGCRPRQRQVHHQRERGQGCGHSFPPRS